MHLQNKMVKGILTLESCSLNLTNVTAHLQENPKYWYIYFFVMFTYSLPHPKGEPMLIGGPLSLSPQHYLQWRSANKIWLRDTKNSLFWSSEFIVQEMSQLPEKMETHITVQFFKVFYCLFRESLSSDCLQYQKAQTGFIFQSAQGVMTHCLDLPCVFTVQCLCCCSKFV